MGGGSGPGAGAGRRGGRSRPGPLLADFLEDLAERTAARLRDVAGVAVTSGLDTPPVTIGSSSDLALEVALLQQLDRHGSVPARAAVRRGLDVPDLGADDRTSTFCEQRRSVVATADPTLSAVRAPFQVDAAP